jgi:hypothetical protein
MLFSYLAFEFAFYFPLLVIFIAFRLMLSWFATMEATSSEHTTTINRIFIGRIYCVRRAALCREYRDKAEDILVVILAAGPIPRHRISYRWQPSLCAEEWYDSRTRL